MLYHVSNVSGLTVLHPNTSTHKKAYVYAIDNLITGLLFGAKHDDFDLLICTDEHGVPEVYECYQNAFNSVYYGKSCSVYRLKENGFLRGMTSWSPELVCETDVAVEKEIVVPDLYERLLQAEKDGELILHRYSQNMEYRKIISKHIVDRLIRFGKIEQAKNDTRLQQHFGKLINELNKVMDGHLLK